MQTIDFSVNSSEKTQPALRDFAQEFLFMQEMVAEQRSDANRRINELLEKHKEQREMYGFHHLKRILMEKYFLLQIIQQEKEDIGRVNEIVSSKNEELIGQIEENRKSYESLKLDQRIISLMKQKAHIRIINIEVFPKSGLIEYHLKYKNYFDLLLKKKRKSSYLNSIEIYFTKDSSFGIFREDQDLTKKNLSDLILKFFDEMSKEKNKYTLWEAVNRMCYIFNKFNEIIFSLGQLVRENIISDCQIGFDGKFLFQMKPRVLPFIHFHFSLSTDYQFNWHLSYKQQKTLKLKDSKIHKDVTKILDNIKDSIQRQFSSDQHTPDKLLQIFRNIQNFSLGNPQGLQIASVENKLSSHN